jgi:hypothetical protein
MQLGLSIPGTVDVTTGLKVSKVHSVMPASIFLAPVLEPIGIFERSQAYPCLAPPWTNPCLRAALGQSMLLMARA